MIGAYLDETGNTGSNIRDASQGFHYVGALLIPESAWKPLDAGMKRIAVAALGPEVPRRADFEFHGNQLYTGNGPWRGMDPPARIEVFAECLRLLDDHDIGFVYGRCDKKKLQCYRSPMHPHEISFWLCIERIGLNLGTHLAFMVADDCSNALKQIARSGLDAYRKDGPPFGRPVDISSIIDTVHFMPSVQSPHLQMCDLCLWVTRRYRDSATLKPEVQRLYDMILPHRKGSKTFPY